MSNSKPDDRGAEAPPTPRPNLAHGISIPTMAPPGRPAEQTAAVRTRPTVQRAIKGVGQPQAIAHRDMTNHAHSLLELYKKDPSQIDPTFVQILHLEAMCTYGGEIEGLKSEVARLRKEVEQHRVDDDAGGTSASARDTRRARRGVRPRARGRRSA